MAKDTDTNSDGEFSVIIYIEVVFCVNGIIAIPIEINRLKMKIEC